MDLSQFIEAETLAKIISLYIIFYILAFLALISLWTPTLSEHVFPRWFTWSNIAYLLPIPIIALGLITLIIRSIRGVGVSILLPIILGYTAYCYYIFRGKVTNDGYHT
jgi:cytochrome bd-type quinol oxidase subunit 2